jgi:hypothetical protein
MRDAGIAREAPRERVLAPAAAGDQNAHEFLNLLKTCRLVMDGMIRCLRLGFR